MARSTDKKQREPLSSYSILFIIIFAVAIISTTYLQQTGLSPVRDGIFIEDKNSPYVNIIVTREDNKDAQNVKEFMQSYQSPEVAKAAETIFNGGAVPGW